MTTIEAAEAGTEAELPETADIAVGTMTNADSGHQEHSTSTHPEDSEHPDHPGDWEYIKIAIILGLLTALEVFTYFESVHRLHNLALYALLTVIMLLKFGYVISWFMHLRFDSRAFRIVFTMCIMMSLVLYFSMLTSFRIWEV